MNIILAKTFLAVLEHRNFKRAAEVLHVTQSTVTMRINSLEDIVGQQLFMRNRMGVEPTPVGWTFRPYAEMLIQIWQQARQEVTLPAERSTMLRVGAEPGLWQGIMEDWVLKISEERPEVSLLIVNSEADALNSCLAQGIYDIALMYDARPRTNVAFDFLFDEQLVLVSTTPRQATSWHPEYTYVEWGPDFRMEHVKLQPANIIPPVTINHGSWALQWIERRGGSAYFPIRMIEEKVERGQLYVVPNVNVFTRSVWVSYLERLMDVEWFPPILQDLQEMARIRSERDALLRKQWKLL